MVVKKKKVLNSEEIETHNDEIKEKKEKDTKNTFLLIISIILLMLSIGTYAYLYHENQKLESNINSSVENVKQVQETIEKDKKEITKKEDEYEKLKEKVKDSLEELKIWEDLKEELNKSLS